jgi:tetratricopeptide (TPR) repeat protein/tRNA A-37 threonylcarbamoyl transferase component Bud32
LCLDQHARWTRGQRVLAEHYLSWFPELRQDSEAFGDIVLGEVMLRQMRNEMPTLDEYGQRFGQFADRLADHFAGSVSLPLSGGQHPTTVPAFPAHGVAAPGMPLVPGYEVVNELGRGGMGVVYKARQLQLNRWVALKRISDNEPGLHARFQAEAEAVARLQHPHIVQIYEIGQVAGQAYLALELVDGGSLDARINGQPQSALFAATIVQTLARAVQYAHDRGVVHRDLKPDNVLLTTEGTPKLTDFGLARQLDVDSRKTRAGTVLGTPSYMAPEQAQGHIDQVGPLSDVYSLGAILYELLTGEPPFQGETPLDTIMLVCLGEVRSPRKHQPTIPTDLEIICLKCLEKEPGRRYESALALAEDLSRFLAHQPILARPAGTLERVWKWARRKPYAAAAAGLGLAVALSGVAIGGLYVVTEMQRAQLLARDSAERDRLKHLLAETQDFLHQAQAANARSDWSEAEAAARAAIAAGAGETLAAEFVAAAGKIRQHAQARLHDHARRQRFERKRDEALFAAAEITGRASVDSVRLVTAAATEALQHADVNPAAQVLILLLADCAPDAAAGVRWLDQANDYGPPTRFGLQVRARRLRQLGDDAGAKLAQQNADALTPAHAGDYFLLGRHALFAGQPAQAITLLTSALRLQPDQEWAEFFLALAYLRDAKPTEARGHLTAGLGRRRNLVWLYILRGVCQYELREYAAAAKDYDDALALEPDDTARHCILTNRGTLRWRLEQPDAAEADLRAAIALKPADYMAYLNLGRICEANRDTAGALTAFTQALERVPAGDPTQVVLHRTRAKLHTRQGDLAAARADWAAVMRLDPNPTNRQTGAQDRVEYGALLDKVGEPAEAAKWASAAVQLNPQLQSAQRLRADALLKAKQPAEALAALDDYLAQSPADPAAFRARGMLRAQLGRATEALTDYGRALELHADRETLVLRGWAYLIVHDSPKLALTDFAQAITVAPTHGEAYAGRGMARLRLGLVTEAVGDAATAVKHGPTEPRLYYHAARVYAKAAQADRSPAEQTRWTNEALRLVAQALEAEAPAGRRHFWRKVVQGDPLLVALRSDPAWGRLHQQYGAKLDE